MLELQVGISIDCPRIASLSGFARRAAIQDILSFLIDKMKNMAIKISQYFTAHVHLTAYSVKIGIIVGRSKEEDGYRRQSWQIALMSKQHVSAISAAIQHLNYHMPLRLHELL